MELDPLAGEIFNCQSCSSAEKETRGCLSPTEKFSWEIDPCVSCGGKGFFIAPNRIDEVECEVCKGSGVISVNRCPRAIITESKYLIPFFIDYYGGLEHGLTIYPDGKGRFYQPIKLLQAFNLMTSEYTAIKKRESESQDA